MTTYDRPTAVTTDDAVATPRHGATTHPELDYEPPAAKAFRYVAAALRLSLGWVFMWAFLDKTFALGFGTGRDGETGVVDRFGDAAWINGGSPTEGFLTFATKGPLAETYQSIAGAPWANVLFMLSLFGVGLALLLGIGMRAAAVAGTAVLVMMWTAVLPPENNPFMDDHIIYALVLVALALVGAGKTIGLGSIWERLPVVQRYGFLK